MRGKGGRGRERDRQHKAAVCYDSLAERKEEELRLRMLVTEERNAL